MCIIPWTVQGRRKLDYLHTLIMTYILSLSIGFLWWHIAKLWGEDNMAMSNLQSAHIMFIIMIIQPARGHVIWKVSVAPQRTVRVIVIGDGVNSVLVDCRESWDGSAADVGVVGVCDGDSALCIILIVIINSRKANGTLVSSNSQLPRLNRRHSCDRVQFILHFSYIYYFKYFIKI